MNPIRDEARKIAEQDRAALTATMTQIERETLLRKLQRRVRHNLRELVTRKFETSIAIMIFY